MQLVGLLILMVGVGLSAAFGSQLSAPVYKNQLVGGRAGHVNHLEQGAFDAYCKLRGELKLDARDGCKGKDGKPSAISAPEGAAPGDDLKPADAARFKLQAELGRLAAVDVVKDLGDATLEPADLKRLQEARVAWLSAKRDAVDAKVEAAGLPVTKPDVRLNAWMGEAGGGFAAGLVLVVLGAFMSRSAHRKALQEGGGDGNKDDAGPVDFGVLLASVGEEVSKLAEELSAIDNNAELHPYMDRISTLQLEPIEAMIQAAPRLQIRFGMQGFAQLFDPLSTAERKVNRAWSALADSHVPEATDSIKRASTALAQAQGVLDRLVAQAK